MAVLGSSTLVRIIRYTDAFGRFAVYYVISMVEESNATARTREMGNNVNRMDYRVLVSILSYQLNAFKWDRVEESARRILQNATTSRI